MAGYAPPCGLEGNPEHGLWRKGDGGTSGFQIKAAGPILGRFTTPTM